MPLMFYEMEPSKDIAIYCYKDGNSTVTAQGNPFIYDDETASLGIWTVSMQPKVRYPIHNLNGPAITYVDGTFEWFIDGERLTKIQWLDKGLL